MMNRQNLSKIQRQSGAVLIVSLVILLIITLLAFSGSENVVMQEKMTFSAQDSRVALQSAEIGLITAEAYIENDLTNTSVFKDDGTGGLYTSGNAPEDVWADATWAESKTRAASTKVQDGVVVARYFIEYLGANGSIRTFRIVSRGEGISDSTERIVEGYYAKKF